MDLFLFVSMIFAIVFVAVISLFWLFKHIVPFLFKNRIQKLEADRMNRIERMRNVGIKVMPDNENPRYFTSVR